MKNRNLILALIVFGNLTAISAPLTARPNVKKYEAQELQRRGQLRRQREAYERAELQKMEKSRAEQSAQREKIAKYASRAGRFIENSLTFCNGQLLVADGYSIQHARHLAKALTTDMLYPVYAFQKSKIDLNTMLNDGITERYNITFYLRAYDYKQIYSKHINKYNGGHDTWSLIHTNFSSEGIFNQLLNKPSFLDLFLLSVQVNFYKNGITYADTTFRDMEFGGKIYSLLNALNSEKQFIKESILPCAPEKDLLELAPESPDSSQRASQQAHAVRTDDVEVDTDPVLGSSDQNLAKLEAALGKMYYDGEGVPQNNHKAEEWFRKAADHGDGDAQVNLVDMYLKGQSTSLLRSEVEQWLRPLAMKGDTDAQAILGHLYYKGNDYRTYDEAAQWLLKAAEGGHRQAQETLGIKYSTGDRVRKSLAEAEYWLRKAADQGSDSAKKSLVELGF